ncbi:Hypothetical protein A7982_05956 [Minicystis rosea]|nr:Hypothetical protein A7982_05956 [Minicystis rosea]
MTLPDCTRLPRRRRAFDRPRTSADVPPDGPSRARLDGLSLAPSGGRHHDGF